MPTNSLTILKACPAMSLQDAGRRGVAAWGIPSGGAMDHQAMQLANRLVGNEPNAAVIEMALIDVTLLFHYEAYIACTGAVQAIMINEQTHLPNHCLNVQALDVVQIKVHPKANFYYLAIAGNLQAKRDFGSCSTYPLARLGGLDGTYLKKGDVLHWEVSAQKIKQSKVLAPHLIPLYDAASPIIRVLKGPEFERLTEASKQQLESLELYLSTDCNRMAYRALAKGMEASDYQITSSMVVPGSIQLSGPGQCTILMRDAQTSGGYPRILQVIAADLARLAQLKPNQSFKLRLVDLAEAHQANSYWEGVLNSLRP
jgi:antagonist of KipI